MPAVADTAAPGSARLQVGDWAVEPALFQLSAKGRTVKLEPKAMAVLVYLADRPGEVVSREALLSAVWPGVVVGDDSVTQVVIKLRKALGDAAENPAYIQTIAKGGYRLVAQVARPEHAVPQTSPARRLPRVRWAAGAGVAALLLAGAAVWWTQSERGAAPARAPAAGPVGAQPSVAVRPFEALTNDQRETVLARGITADLVTDLSKVSGLQVIGVETGAPQSGYLVSGSVQRIGERLRLQVHLSDTETGKQLWSERYDRPLVDLFSIQEELGPKILGILPAKVGEAELRRVAHRYTHNVKAYEDFHRGQLALIVRQREENEAARELFRRAIAQDAGFARAYAGLALTYTADYRNQWTADGAAALDRALDMAQTAYQIDPDIPETYWVLAFVHMERRRHDEALRYLDTAVRLYPSFADGYALMGGVKTYAGQPAESVRLLRTAMRLKPEAGYLYFLNLGKAYLFLGDLEQARVNLQHALARNPVNLETHVYMAALNSVAGEKSAAAWEAEEIRSLLPGFSIRAWLETYPMTDPAQKAKLVQSLGELGF
jgi:DNA-binding winged helix-turn-helix (wHTH) protein/TolB-like protein/Tfp pilus assembly protein PilF